MATETSTSLSFADRADFPNRRTFALGWVCPLYAVLVPLAINRCA